MQLEFTNEFKSIEAGGLLQLPSFVVLTGLNGSGKTQLLQAISENHVSVTTNGVPAKKKALILSNQLNPGHSPIATVSQTGKAYDLLSNFANKLIAEGENIAEEGEFVKRRTKEQRTDANFTKLAPIIERILKISFSRGRKQISKSEIRQLVTRQELGEFHQERAFHQEFSVTFLRYFQDWRDNKFARFLRDQEGESIHVLSDSQFYALKGMPPWDLINEMLRKMEIPYSINQPISHENDFNARLTNHNNGATISFSDLSSGEQTLCSLAIALYQSEQNGPFPDLLLLDEPDAHLHPKMISNMIDVLSEVILPQMRCGLILTTHSPSTVALAPNSSLHLMQGQPRRPSPVKVDEALDALCVGLPTISIRKEKERQIFVESRIDAEIFGRIWTKTKETDFDRKTGISLNFISSGKGYRTGNCEQAIDLCNNLRKAGSTSAYAIIDYDLKNKSTSTVAVLAEGVAYSIENLVLNPVAIVGILYHFHGDHAPMPDFTSTANLVNLSSLEVETLQRISNDFCEHFKNNIEKFRKGENLAHKFSEISFHDDLAKFELRDGRELTIPSWYLNSKGHSIEDALRLIFPELNRYGNKAGDLMLAVVQHVLANHLNLVPNEIMKTLQKIHS